jgi:hypothetical protein
LIEQLPKMSALLKLASYERLNQRHSGLQKKRRQLPRNLIVALSARFGPVALTMAPKSESADIQVRGGRHNCAASGKNSIMSWRSPEFYSNRVMFGIAFVGSLFALMAVTVRFY